ncbi:MAG: orotate phosphoribosyltransferase, partial [Xenococcaceae cyanobacterium]
MPINSFDPRLVVTADLISLRQILLDLFAKLAYQEGDFILSSG